MTTIVEQSCLDLIVAKWKACCDEFGKSASVDFSFSEEPKNEF